MTEHAITMRAVNKFYGTFHALVGGDNVAKVRQDVCMVFQSFNLFPHMTVLENCMLAPMKSRKIARAEAETTARQYLDRVNIPEQADKYPAQLSGGQQQRVATARAVHETPHHAVRRTDQHAGPRDGQRGAGHDD